MDEVAAFKEKMAEWLFYFAQEDSEESGCVCDYHDYKWEDTTEKGKLGYRRRVDDFLSLQTEHLQLGVFKKEGELPEIDKLHPNPYRLGHSRFVYKLAQQDMINAGWRKKVE